MKILWLINVPLPEVSDLMREKSCHFGGWLINASQELAKEDNIELSIAFPKKGLDDYKEFKGEKISYYAFKPVGIRDKDTLEDNKVFDEIILKVNPDIVHIYGTEMPHSLSMINICNKYQVKTVISIQGLVSVIAKHMQSNLPVRVICGCTLRNIVKGDNVLGLSKKFKESGSIEIEALKRCQNVIGRTLWDKACTNQINPKLSYYHCNETLREEFYKHTWSLDKCEEHSIFMSQATYPIKGLHNMIEAMPIILKKFNDCKLYIAGKDITSTKSFKEKLLVTYYGKYIKSLIRKYSLEGKVIFTGPLDEQEMCKRYLKSNVFISPSAIENSPNSLAEAMILGVPSVASDVGGVTDMIEHKKEGFVYPSDAPYMLAYYVCEIFKNKDQANTFSKNAKKRASVTHDIERNNESLKRIYKQIIEER